MGSQVGYGACEPRIEGNIKKMWGEGEGQYFNP